jgi:hypothetical protein
MTSKIENKIVGIIKKEAITNPGKIKNIQREFSFPDLKYKGTLLRFDIAFLYKGNRILCEVDGSQHYKNNNFFFKNSDKFKHMQENDRRKNKYCLDNHILLYRIPYYDIDKILNFNDIFKEKYRVKSIYHNDDLIFKSKL